MLLGHTVQPGRVRGDLIEQVNSKVGLGGEVDVYLPTQGEKDTPSKNNREKKGAQAWKNVVFQKT